MKTTIEVPDALFRRAKSVAAQRGIPLRALVSEALIDKLRTATSEDKPWMKTFGKLRRLHTETLRIKPFYRKWSFGFSPRANQSDAAAGRVGWSNPAALRNGKLSEYVGRLPPPMATMWQL